MYGVTVRRALLAVLFGATVWVGVAFSPRALSGANHNAPQIHRVADGGGGTWPPPKI